MIHWTWLILAFVVGGNVGLFIMAAIACGHESDRMMGRMMGRMIRIDDYIKELQQIREKFGNTCVYIRDASWGGMALNRQAEDERTEKLLAEKMEARYEDRDISDSGSDSGTGGNNRDGSIQYPHRASGRKDRQPTGRY